MAVVLTALTNVIENPITVLPPITVGLEYGNLFDSQETLGRNLALGKPLPSVVGDPVMGADYADFTQGSAYIETGVEESADFTYIAVSTPLVENAFEHIISNYVFGVTPTASLYTGEGVPSDGKKSVTAGITADNGGNPTLYTRVPQPYAIIGEPHCMGARFSSATGLLKSMSLTNGASSEGAPTGGRLQGTSGLRVGYNQGGVNSGTVRIYAALIYSTALTDVEIAQTYQWLEARYASKGITI
ncbi:hypothetical protein [Sulfitobacter dubius]|uniref:hypothetical protein n=1 Tax=Sulfitobacter dubius TaxID=218673 RepID=UPI002942DC6E|nr:hypothetical protein [Sulfitobacter dubius]WOI30033.1 hypothetical protein R1T39_04840 [Sulfitobacter dubius]